MKRLMNLLTTLFIGAACSLPVQAHIPLFDCYDNADGSISCEGGFSDGGSAEGIQVRLLDPQGRVIAQERLGRDNTVDFERPPGEFTVIFDAGAEHNIRIFSDDIY